MKKLYLLVLIGISACVFSGLVIAQPYGPGYNGQYCGNTYDGCTDSSGCVTQNGNCVYRSSPNNNIPYTAYITYSFTVSECMYDGDSSCDYFSKTSCNTQYFTKSDESPCGNLICSPFFQTQYSCQ